MSFKKKIKKIVAMDLVLIMIFFPYNESKNSKHFFTLRPGVNSTFIKGAGTT